MEDMGIEQARQALGTIVDRARWENEATRILRHGQHWAVVVSDQWFDAVTESFTIIDLMLEDKDARQEWQSGMIALREARRKAARGRPGKRWVDHIDGDPRNNDPANLRIVDAPDTEEDR